MLQSKTSRTVFGVVAFVVIMLSILLFIRFMKGHFANDTNVAHKPEQQLTRTLNTDSLYHAGFLAGEAKGRIRYRALQRDSAAAATQDKRKTEKARQSAVKYVAMPTLANCDTALTDCQAEIETKKAVIASRDKMLLAKDSTLVNRLAEINRQTAVIDTLGNGWKAANLDNAKKDKKLKNRNTLIKILGAAVAVLVGVIAVK